MAALLHRKLYILPNSFNFCNNLTPSFCIYHTNRRQKFRGTSYLIKCIKSVTFQNNRKMSEEFSFKYPEARRDETVVDNYFGVEIKDPYRWLEDPDSHETKTFIEKQNAITKKFLLKSESGHNAVFKCLNLQTLSADYKLLEFKKIFQECQYRDSVNKSLKEMWDHPKYSCPFFEGNRYFFYMNTGLQNQSVLYIMKSLNATPEVFLDPNELSPDGTVALNLTQFSEDGSTLAYGLSSGGSDWLTIHFKNVQTGGNYEETLTRVKFSTISWTHDNKGIFYAMYPQQKPTVTENLETHSDEHQKLYYHRLGTPQKDDILVLEFPDEPKFRISTDVSHCGRYLIVYLQKDCRDNLVYFCDFQKINYKINGKLPIVEVVNKLEADYEYVTNTGSEVIFRTNKNASNYRLIKINFESPEESSWTTLIKEHPNDVLDWAVPVNKNKLIVCYVHHVKDILQYCELSDGKLIYTFPTDVSSIVGFSGKKKLTEIFYMEANFLTTGIIYRCELNDPNLKTTIFKQIQPKGFDRDQFEMKQVFYSSKDGTKIPMFLVHRKNLKLDGTNPCLLYGYGGFNISIKPYFSVTMTVFMKHVNGVLAFPNIRGGGEYGDKWHNQGRFEKKQNTFDDFIAAAKYLISSGYTSSNLLTIKGDSNGGLIVAACMIQQPQLFGAVLCGVGVTDMLRFHKFTIGSAWISDYGSSDVKEQFEYLLKYSPLHNVTCPPQGVQYPAVLLSTANRDDRVVPHHSLKFIATLQYVLQKCPHQRNPLLMRVEVQAGHGVGKPTYKTIEEATDLLCFAIQALDLKFHP